MRLFHCRIHTEIIWRIGSFPGDTSEDVVRRMRSLRTSYELREKWSYNNQVRALSPASFHCTKIDKAVVYPLSHLYASKFFNLALPQFVP